MRARVEKVDVLGWNKSNTTFVRQFHPGNISIPIAATLHAQEELKLQYDRNLRVFHKTRGVERALIQKLVLDVEAKYITAMRNRTTGQFTGTLFILIHYLIVTYRKTSPRQRIKLEHKIKLMQYDLQAPIP